MRCFSPGVLFWGALLLPAWAAFVPPAEGPVPFRRDRLPLDADTMSALSRQLGVLAAAEQGEQPGQRRALAQMVALALALDPTNREARELIEAAEKGSRAEPPPEADRELARSRAWQAYAWLEMPEAGADGQALAACLGDVLAVADPRHPKARARGAERGAWAVWVAEKEAFESREVVTPVEPEIVDAKADEVVDETHTSFAIKEISMPLPLWSQDPETGEEALRPVQVTLRTESGGGRLEFMVAGEGLTKRFQRPLRTVADALKARHGTLPGGVTAAIGFDGGAEYSASRNGDALTGTVALLLEGALTGQVPSAVVLAQVGEGGKLELPAKFWKSLRAFSELPGGGRVILPDQAAEFLPALLTMDQAAFFMRREILLAGTVDELWNLAASAPEGDAGEGIKRFEEIRKVGEGKALGTFVANQATQQRLREVIDLMPKHASARMLAVQGAGNRPRVLQRPVLARELRAALDPAAILLKLQPREDKEEELDRAHQASRAVLDPLAGYVDIRDRELMKSAMEVADSLRTLARLLAKSEDDYGNVTPKQAAAVKAARATYAEVIRSLTDAAGDEADYPSPKLPDEDKK